ncbi:hypothetical protein LTR37_011024 [Vermiconidia calcicola]|uniref:Uncharacterized protein n=1 Tax=Vermiconidia calcicola TaxID=1690605 RepID=A0ACC3N693_9PEZI|nr:hypothetical protein LTR37_011024 [Vermiconidia calcicola]
MRSLLKQLLAVGPELAAFILSSPLLGPKGAYAIPFTEAPSPNLDLSQLGRVAVAGDFDSISLYEYEGQNGNVFNTEGSQSLLTRFPNGAFQSLGISDAYIEAMCTFSRNGEVQGVVLGGNFTSVDGVQALSVALWDTDTGDITPLPGINGKVSALYCDDDSGTVYVGGFFTAGNSTNAMAWTTEWTDLSFAGFNGPVYWIEKNAANKIVFGGEFDGLGMVINGSSASTPPSGQAVRLGGGNIGASGTATTAGFDDPMTIICSGGDDGPGSTWLLADNTGGWWQGQFSFGFVPTKLRLYNTKYQGRGTKTFYFENLNSGGILNLNYIDEDGKNQSCSERCPLPQGNTTYQEFFMVPPVGMDSFRIYITEWYGDGGGLAGIEMFQDQMFSFAIDEFNEPQCNGNSPVSSSAVTPDDGFWVRTEKKDSTSDYLTATITSESQLDSNPSVVFTPSIAQEGNYSILIYTPGCLQDGTCGTRGSVNLTGAMTSEGEPVSTTVSQTNYYDKFDQIYYGFIDVDSGSFIPSVTLAPLANQTLPQTIVAQRVRFDVVQTTGGLNGLFEYDPNEAVIDTDFSKSAIDSAGADLDPGVIVNRVVAHNNQVYVAGKFTGDGIQNIMRVGQDANSLPGRGLNADVQALYLDGSTMYLGGNFANTADGSEEGLNNVAAFDVDSSEWSTLGAGVDGTVWDIVPLSLNVTAGSEEACITINGDFTSVNAFGDNDAFDANGFAVWVPSRNNWLDNIPNAEIAVSGKLLTMTPVPELTSPLYAGQLTSHQLGMSGAVALVGSSNPILESLGVRIQSSTTAASSRKRAIDLDQTVGGVYSGLFYDENGHNVTVLGGHFSATATDGSTIENLIFIDNSNSKQRIAGADELDSGSTIAAMAVHDTFVFAGGSLTGSVDDNDLNGLIVYDLEKLAIASPHPPSLGGGNVIVNAIAAQPDSSSVYVAGDFQTAGSLPCETLCYYDTSTDQWKTPGLGLSGTITSMFWSSKTQLIIAGDLTVGGNQTTMATYDQKKQTFSSYQGGSSLPGGITALTPASSDYNEFWAAGIDSDTNEAFLSHYTDDKWNNVGGLGEGTIIRSLQIMSLTKEHGDTNLLSRNQVLMIVGNINTPSSGDASAVLFNGTTFEPLILTTKDDGSQGTIAGIFVSNPSALMQMSGGHLAVGFVVLIGLAIALGIIFLIVVAGILIERTRRRREGYIPMKMDKNGNLERIPPETLLGGLNEEKGSAPQV